MALDGKVAVVTGGNRGIGQGVALRLGRAGARVAILDREPADETVQLPTAMGDVHLAYGPIAGLESAEAEAT